MANAVKEFVTELVDEIEEGIYDKYLRRIARACYSRRGQLEDGTGVVSDELQVPTIVESDDEVEAKHINGGTVTAAYRSAKEVFSDGVPAEAAPVPKGRRVRNDAFRWNGDRYWRHLIEGRLVYFDGSYRPAKRRHMCVEVVSIYEEGSSLAQVKVLASDNDPQAVGHTFTISRNMLMKKLLGRS